MTSFEYLSVFVAVIMGLAVTRILSAIGGSLRHRRSITAYWAHSCWVFNVLVYVISVWWTLFAWNQLPEWNYFLFIFIVLYAVVLYLLTDVLYPDHVRPGLDMEAHFLEHRGPFFGLLLVAVLLDIPETVMKDLAGLRPVPASYWVLHTVWLVVSLVGILTANRRVHVALPVLWLTSTLVYIGWGVLILSG